MLEEDDTNTEVEVNWIACGNCGQWCSYTGAMAHQLLWSHHQFLLCHVHGVHSYTYSYTLIILTRGCHVPINCGEICDRAVKVLTEKFYCIDEALASFIAKILLDP